MKRKIIAVFVLIFMFLIFVIIENDYQKPSFHKILDVIEADEFYIDLNNDNKIQDDELIRLLDVTALKPVQNYSNKSILEKLSINRTDYLKAGYIARHWAKDELLGKYIEVVELKNINDKKYAKINYNNKDLGLLLLKNGMAFQNDDINNLEYIKENPQIEILNNANALSDLDFSILNLKNNIYHKLNCEYSDKISNGVIELTKNCIKKSYFPCKVCHISNKYIKFSFDEIPKSRGKYLKSVYKKDKNIEIYLINPLEFKKPNKNCSTDISKRIIKEINSAQKSIDIALYGIGEQDEIINALRNAKKRGVIIRSIVDYSRKMDELYPNTKDFIKEFSSKTDKTEKLMHNKFFIFDDKKVLTGSINLSSTGSGGYNANNVVILNSKDVADIYKEEFNQMFEGKFQNRKNKIQKNEITLDDSKIQIYFTPRDDTLNEAFLNNIKNAKKEIFVSIFYLTDRKVITELIQARKRGVNVLILADALYANAFRDRINYLKSNKIPVIVENWGGKNHEKTMVIDSFIFITGSCNFSQSGFNKNDENILVLKNKNIAELYRDYFLYLFNSIDKKYLIKIPRAEGFESINSCNDGIDNNFDGKIDSDDDGCKIKNKK